MTKMLQVDHILAIKIFAMFLFPFSPSLCDGYDGTCVKTFIINICSLRPGVFVSGEEGRSTVLPAVQAQWQDRRQPQTGDSPRSPPAVGYDDVFLQDLESVTVRPSLLPASPNTTNIAHIITSSITSQDPARKLVTESQLLLSSTQSIQNSSDLQSSNLSSAAPSQLPSASPDTILLHFAFLVLLILVRDWALYKRSVWNIFSRESNSRSIKPWSMSQSIYHPWRHIIMKWCHDVNDVLHI